MKKLIALVVIYLCVLLSANKIFAEDITPIQVPNSSTLINQNLPLELNSQEQNSQSLLPTSKSVEKNIFIPAGIEVFFNVRDVYSSKTITTSTKIPIFVANDVYYKNNLIFNKGAIGYMYPSYVNKAGKFGNNGKLNFESAYTQDVNGNEQLLSVNYNTQGRKVFYSGAGGILANSKNAEVGPGTLFSGKIVNAFQIRLKLND